MHNPGHSALRPRASMFYSKIKTPQKRLSSGKTAPVTSIYATFCQLFCGGEWFSCVCFCCASSLPYELRPLSVRKWFTWGVPCVSACGNAVMHTDRQRNKLYPLAAKVIGQKKKALCVSDSFMDVPHKRRNPCAVISFVKQPPRHGFRIALLFWYGFRKSDFTADRH